MAVLDVGTLRAILELRDAMAPELLKASKRLQQWSRKTQRSMRRVSDTGRMMTTSISMPLVALGGVAVKAAIDFESAWTGVLKTVDDASDATGALTVKGEELQTALQDLAKEIPITAVELAGVAEAAGQLGVQTEHIAGFTETMAMLGVTTNLSALDAATALARIKEITGMAATDFDRLGSTIVALGNNFATNEAEITEFGLRIAASGAQAGMSEADFLSIGTAVASVGIKAEAGGTAINKAINQITTATVTGNADLRIFAATAGMTSDQFRQAWEQDAATAFAAFIEGLGAQGKNALLTLGELGLDAERVGKTMMSLANAGDLVTRTLETGRTAWLDNTALLTEAELRFGTTASQLKLLANNAMDAARVVGDALGPIITIVIEQVRETVIPTLQAWADKFAALSPETQRLAVAAGALLIALGPVVFLLGQLGGAVAGIAAAAAAVLKLSASFVSLKASSLAFAATPIGVALVALGAAALVTYKNIQKLERQVDKKLNPAIERLDGTVMYTAKDVEALAGETKKLENGFTLTIGSGRDLADTLDDVATGASSSIVPVETLSTAVIDLRDQIGGRGLQAEVENLHAAWMALDPVERTNEDNMRRAAAEATSLDNAGADLTSELQRLLAVMQMVVPKVDELTDGLRLAWMEGIKTSDTIPLVTEGIEGINGGLEDVGGMMPGFFGNLKNSMGGMGGDINSIFMSALEGGGNIMGAAKSLSIKVAEGLLGGIPFVGPMLAQFAGPIVAGIGKLYGPVFGAFKRLFGGISKDEQAGRDMVEAFEDSVISALDASQLAEAGGERWKQVVIGVRDAYVAAGRSAEEGEEAVGRLWDAIKDGGPEAVKAILAEIDAVRKAGDAATEEIARLDAALEELVGVTIEGLRDLVAEAKTTGELAPENLKPYLDTLVEAGRLTEENAALLMQMAEDAYVDWRGMEEAAEKYGLSLHALGPKFKAAKIHDEAMIIVDDFLLLVDGGADVGKVIAAMGPEIQGVVDEAGKMGVAIPDAMRPVIQAMIDNGELVDENGEAYTDISQIDFANPVVDKFDAIILKLEELINALIGDNGVTDAVADVGDAVEDDIPDEVTVDVVFNVGPVPPMPHIPDYSVPVNFRRNPRMPGFQGGTGGEFVNFGAGTPVMLHGRERITPIAEAGREAAQLGGMDRRLASIERLLRDQPRALALAVSDNLARVR